MPFPLCSLLSAPQPSALLGTPWSRGRGTAFYRKKLRLRSHIGRVKKTLSKKTISKQTPSAEYGGLFGGIAELLEAARHAAARTVNAVMTATYWEIGRRIVEFEQQGATRAGYGEQILAKLSQDLTKRFGRGFGVDNLQRFRSFFLSYPTESIYATLSRKLPEVLLVRSQTPPIPLHWTLD